MAAKHRRPQGLALQEVTAAQLARRLDGLLEGDASLIVRGAAPLHAAQRDDLTFFCQNSWSGEARATCAGLVLAPFGIEGWPGSAQAVLQVADPYAALCLLLQEFHEPLVEWSEGKISWDAQVHPSAVVEGVVWPGAQIGPHCVVMQGAEIGWGSVLEAQVTVYPGVTLGKDCIVQAGVVLGARGFGFRNEGTCRTAVRHYAGVEIGDGVQIGANSVVAAGFLEPTRIGNGCCLDSFVQIAHHCQLGSDVFMASGAGLAGGVHVGDNAQFGGAAQVAQHLHIGAAARVAAKSGVTRSVAPGEVVAGFPAEPIALWRKAVVALRSLARS